jgi:CPA2 family monovalent cation:H+ antiporter-2
MHDISLITTIALGLSAALLFGLLAKRLGLSPIVGYLVAGMTIGPHTPGVMGDLKIAGQLAEMGVILLMFGVGLQFSLKELLAVRSVAVPGALGQSAVATLACAGLAVAVGWTWQTGLILGIAVSIASTVVLLRALMDHGGVNTPEGHAVVGWLIVQDIIAVFVLVLLPPLAATGGDGASLWQTIGIALLKLLVLTAIVLLAGARFVPWLLLRVARLRSRELFTLTVLVMAICVATVSYVAFGASMALGAFLGGMVVGQSKVSEEAAADVLPMRNVFAVLFFVSVGMLFDYRVLLDSPLLVIGVLAIILFVTPVGRVRDCDRRRPLVADRAHCRRRPRADRRVLVHRRGYGEVARPSARHGQQCACGRSNHLDQPPSLCLPRCPFARDTNGEMAPPCESARQSEREAWRARE